MKRKQIERLDRNDRTGDISLDVPGHDGNTQADSLIQLEYNAGCEHPTPEQLLIRQAVKYLTPKQRAVWEYWNYDKLTQDEIASKLKITHQAVSKHISAAEKRIERYCKANWSAYELLKSDLGERD